MAVPTDQDHGKISECPSKLSEPLFTTDYVVDETLTLLRARGYDQRAVALGTAFFDGSLAIVRYLDESDIHDGWETFLCYQDKKWSFTDCVSKVIIEKLKITRAISWTTIFDNLGLSKFCLERFDSAPRLGYSACLLRHHIITMKLIEKRLGNLRKAPHQYGACGTFRWPQDRSHSLKESRSNASKS